MLAYGSLVQEGWKKGKRFRTIVFVMAIALGGLLLTRSWSLFNEYEQKKAIMLSVVRDWKLNSQVLEFPKFSATDDKTLSEKFPYPMFYSGSLNPAISSGVFRHNNHNDSETLKIICAYNISLTKLQNTLDLHDQTIFVGLGRNPLKEWRQIRESPELHLFKRVHNRLGELLKRDRWLAQEHFLRMPDDLMVIRELHVKLGAILNRDPNKPIELNIDDWTILHQWHTKLSDMIKPGGYFERDGLLREDSPSQNIIRTVHDRLGQVFQRTTFSTEGFRVLDKDVYQEIVKYHGKITILLKYDRWILKELDLLQLDI
jgi:hypothetical protein